MNWYFVAAALLMFAIGLIHSVFGERLIFRRMRSTGFIPTNGGKVLREPHVRILWASWHLVTAMGSGMAVMLLCLALPSSSYLAQSFVVKAIIAAALVSSVLVFIGTKGKHLGWAGLLGVALITAIGMSA